MSIPPIRAPNGVVGLAGLRKSDMKSWVPSLATATQGSLARALLPSVHWVMSFGIVLVHVAPPSLETTPTRPREPPSDQRSCWWPTSSREGVVGSTATHGSIAVSG